MVQWKDSTFAKYGSQFDSALLHGQYRSGKGTNMFTLILFVAILGDQPDGVVIPDKMRDLAFLEAQEDCLYRFKTVHKLDDVLPKKQARLVRRLGCTHFECREDAEEELTELGDQAARAVYWGTRTKNAEIVMRSRNIWERLGSCSHCSTTGKCPTCNNRERYPDDSSCPERCVFRDCVQCRGTGNLWYIDKRIYDNHEWLRKREKRKLFLY